MTAEGKSEKMMSDMEVHMKQKCVIEFLHAKCKFLTLDTDKSFTPQCDWT